MEIGRSLQPLLSRAFLDTYGIDEILPDALGGLNLIRRTLRNMRKLAALG